MEPKEIVKMIPISQIYGNLTGRTIQAKNNVICPICNSGDNANKTPGFHLYEKTNSWHCFSCNNSGDGIELVSKTLGMGYKESLEYLLKDFHPNYEPKDDIQQSKKPQFDQLKIAIKKNNPEKAIEYLQTQRKIIVSNSVKHHIFQDDVHHAVAFLDKYEQLINLRGIQSNLKKNAKGSQLQNAYTTIAYRNDSRRVYLTEGVINALSLHTIGESAIAFFSTSNNFSDADKLKHYLSDKEIVLAFDPDDAGRKYSDYWLKMLKKSSFAFTSVSILILPDKEDVNDLLIDGRLSRHIENPQHYQVKLNERTEHATNLLNIYSIIREKDGQVKDLKINYLQLNSFFRDLGYLRYDLDSTSIFIRNQNNILSPVTMNQIQDDFFDQLESLPDELEDGVRKDLLKEKFYRTPSQYFNEARFNLLKPTEPLIFVKDTKINAYLFFKNAFIKITADKIELLPYDQLKGKIWKNQLINHPFYLEDVPTEDTPAFIKFLQNISYSEDRFNSLRTVIGYLAHSYFDGKLKAIILTDSRLDDGANGRSGKTLLAKSLGYIKVYSELNGKDFDPSNKHKFQSLGIDTQIVHINDAKSSLSFETLFNDITEGISIEKKGKDPTRIFAKIILSVNRTLNLDGGSARDRAYEFELADYYSDKFSPLDEFGVWFFSDWKEKDWNQFYNFYIRCIQYYLQHGLLAAAPINLLKRKLKESTNKDFIDFMDIILKEKYLVIGREILKRDIHQEFLTRYPEYREGSRLRHQRNFTVFLRKWAEFTPGISKEIIERNSGNDQFIQFQVE